MTYSPIHAGLLLFASDAFQGEPGFGKKYVTPYQSAGVDPRGLFGFVHKNRYIQTGILPDEGSDVTYPGGTVNYNGYNEVGSYRIWDDKNTRIQTSIFANALADWSEDDNQCTFDNSPAQVNVDACTQTTVQSGSSCLGSVYKDRLPTLLATCAPISRLCNLLKGGQHMCRPLIKYPLKIYIIASSTDSDVQAFRPIYEHSSRALSLLSRPLSLSLSLTHTHTHSAWHYGDVGAHLCRICRWHGC